ncbi:hypothetical protein PENTCL1PPCAC_19879 [Pristionchus entomophagus]|uniref:SET domain-containing protein n=1 Tax=Pristionchus entomophagus TaxID=358040 RepID=A0AAV5TUN4_9BILA|nr:hypothetical protein PENTCL1PPCAC_19879 [Pristionchus entomophagus]
MEMSRVRTLRAFEAGDVVLEFNEEIKTFEKSNKDYSFVVYNDNDVHSEKVFKDNFMDLSSSHFMNNLSTLGTICIDPARKGGIGRIVGHSKMCNVIPIRVYSYGSYIGAPRLYYVALFTIPPVNYGEDSNIVDCLCEESLCHDLPTLSNLLNMDSYRKRKNFAWDVIAEREFYNRDRLF